MRDFKVNWVQVLIGILALSAGTLIYLSDRSPGSTYFVKRFVQGLSFHARYPDLFGIFDRSMASFLHVFSFIMITAGFITASVKGYAAVTAGWLIVDVLFESGQYFDAAAVRFVPEWFNRIPVLEAVKTYFVAGYFDPMDVAAIFAGAVAGFVMVLITGKLTDERKVEQ
jgi:hypothetical protein